MTNEQLVLRIRAGENTAANMAQLYVQNKGMIAKLAIKYQSYAEFDDLMQEGYIGLCHAVDSWKPEEGAFITCAYFWIRHKMVRYTENNSTVRISSEARQKLWKYKKVSQSFYQQFGRMPSDQEICRLMDLSPGWLECIKQAAVMENIGSLNSPVDGSEDLTLEDVAVSEENIEECVLNQIMESQIKNTLWQIVDSLNGKQPEVIRKRYLDKMTLQATSEEMGINRERVRQLENKAMWTLQHSKHTKTLRSFLYDGEIRRKGMQGVGVTTFRRSWTSATERAAIELMG